MKIQPSAYLQQLRDELAMAKTSLENKFTLEPERIQLRNAIPTLVEKIKKVEQKMARHKQPANKDSERQQTSQW